MKLLLALAVIFVMAPGCAQKSTRFLTEEQDAAMREQCEPAGCAVVPIPLMQQIMQRLRGQGA